MSAKRMTANPLKAPRYRPGKAIAEEPSSSEDEDEDEVEVTESKNKKAASPTNAKPRPPATTTKGIRSDLSKVDLNARRQEAEAKEVERLRAERQQKKDEEEGFVTESEEASEDASDSGSEDGESSEESSEEEAPRRVMIRPTFIKKDKRGKEGGTTISRDYKDEEQANREEEERKKKAADELVEEQIRKDIAAREAGRRNWDDDEAAEGDDVDDTDDLDPEAEHAAWKLRELKRIKREREAIEEREREREEVERRKALTEEERKREDDEFIAKQKEERDGKAKAGYLQKYYHKGAFFQDDAKLEGLDKREIMGARFADEVDLELLPQALQMRDMTKLGKKGATKYKDLKSEDTGRWGQFDDRPRRGGGGGAFPADERFMSDREREKLGASGANNVPVGERKHVSGAPTGPRNGREREGELYRPGRDRSRSRTRSPPYESRKRTTTEDEDRLHHDKRRRVGTS